MTQTLCIRVKDNEYESIMQLEQNLKCESEGGKVRVRCRCYPLWSRAEECTVAECGGNVIEEHTTMRDDMHACQGNGEQWNCPGKMMMASVLL